MVVVVIALKRECIPHHCPGLMKVVIIAKVCHYLTVPRIICEITTCTKINVSLFLDEENLYTNRFVEMETEHGQLLILNF